MTPTVNQTLSVQFNQHQTANHHQSYQPVNQSSNAQPMRNTIAACHAKGHAHAQQMHGALMRRNLEKDKDYVLARKTCNN